MHCCNALSLNLAAFAATVLDQNLKDATVVITTPFHPAYMTRERIEASPALKLILTAGIGSDHIDLHAAADNGLTVAEVTGASQHEDVTVAVSPSSSLPRTRFASACCLLRVFRFNPNSMPWSMAM